MQRALEDIQELISVNLPNLQPDTDDELAVTKGQRTQAWDSLD
jgi:hypothetical protein